jgi:ketosteroid isomerase-like protein
LTAPGQRGTLARNDLETKGAALMPGQLDDVTKEFLAALDALDVDRLVRLVTEDVQGVDEISRRWMRGHEELERYFRELTGVVSEVRTQLGDTHEQVSGDTGVLTCWLDQDYTFEGKPQHVSAPTTIVFRRVEDRWRLALFHSIPLPAET